MTSPAPGAEDKEKLELRRLLAEIEKLQADTKKAEWDSATAWTAWLAPVINALTLVILVYTLVSQRTTALDVQKAQGKAAVDLQKAKASAALEIKVVDLIMSSRSPALAQLKAELLGSLHREEVRSPFLDAVKNMTTEREFPGDLGLEMRMKVFEQLVSKYNEPDDIVLLARKTLLGGKGWLDELVPPKPRPTPRTQNS